MLDGVEANHTSPSALAQFAAHSPLPCSAAACRTLQRRPTAQQAVEQVLAAWSAADLYPDAAPALRRMHAAGIKLAALTNGSGADIRAACVPRACCTFNHCTCRRHEARGAHQWRGCGWRVQSICICDGRLCGQQAGCSRLVPCTHGWPARRETQTCLHSRLSDAADTIARGVLQKAGLEGAFTRLLDIQGAGEDLKGGLVWKGCAG